MGRPADHEADTAWIVGRDAELRDVAALLDDVAEGPASLGLVGPPGIGKSTLVDHAAQHATSSHGVLVLRTSPSQADAAIAHSGLADLLRPVDRRALSRLPAPQRDALAVALAERAPTEPVEHLAVAAGLLGVLEVVARRAPVLLAVDDSQWLDSASEAALQFATRRTTGRVGLLWARRAPLPSPPPLPGDVREIGPLGPDAVEGILDGHGPLPRDARRRIGALAAGNPLYLQRLATAVASEGPDVLTTLPPSLAGLVEAHLAGLDRPTRDLLLVATLAARPTVEVLRRACDHHDADVLLARAEATGVIEVQDGAVRFTHPLLAQAAVADAPPGRRRDVHARLAQVVHDPEARARHLVAASMAPGPDVLALVDQAASDAAARGAPSVAAELFDLALAATSDPPDRVRRALAAAEHHLAAGHVERADELLGVVLPAATADLRPAVIGRTALVAMVRGDMRAAAARFAEAVRASETDVDDVATRVWASLHLAFLLTNTDGLAEARLVADRALVDARALDAAAQAGAMATVVMVHALQGEPVDWDLLAEARRLEQVGRARAIPTTSRPLLVEALLLHMVGRLRDAASALDLLHDELAAAGDEAGLSVIDFWAQWIHCGVGDLATAQRRAEEAVARARAIGSGAAEAAACTAVATLAAWRGEEERCRRAGERAVELMGAGSPPSAWPASALALLDLSTGDHRRAAEAYLALGAIADHVGVGHRRGAWWAPDAIESLVGAGLGDAARRLLPLVDVPADHDDPQVGADALAVAARCRALVAASDGALERAEAELRAALDMHAHGDAAHSRARTQLALGGLLRRAGRRREAADLLGEAADAFAGAGMALWAARVRAEADRLGRRAQGSALTASEAQVAALVAEGRTNREVAAALFISPKTVEANLTRIYRKLGVRHRSELTAQILRATTPADS